MTRILIVDDNYEIRDLLKFHLSMEGYSILEAMNGRDACQSIRSIPSNAAIYVIMLSARDDVEDKVSGLDIGADAYLSKPFQPDELKAQIRAGIRTRQATYDGLTGLVQPARL